VDVEQLDRLRAPEGRALLASLPPYDERDVLALGERLRRDGHPPELVAAALTQHRLRARAAGRLGPDAERMWFTADGLEQTTRPVVAQRRAARYVQVGLTDVLDLGCGIGGDAVAFAQAGLRVAAYDVDPLTAAIAHANAEDLGLGGLVQVRCADVRTVIEAARPLDDHDDNWRERGRDRTYRTSERHDHGSTGGGRIGGGLGSGGLGAFVDPARRAGGRRVLNPEQWSPPWSWVRALADRVSATAAKVAPGIAHELLPDGTETEWVSVDGDLVEATVWWGPFKSEGVRHRATLLPSRDTLTDAALSPMAPPTGPVGSYLHEPDGAILRAGLVGLVAEQVSGWLIDPTIAFITSRELIATPYSTAYAVTDVLPFHLKRLRKLLRERGVGRVTVKKRGSAVEPESFRRQLKLSRDAHGEATVVLTRVGGEPTVLVVERLDVSGREG